jgi:hypothetical protein
MIDLHDDATRSCVLLCLLVRGIMKVKVARFHPDKRIPALSHIVRRSRDFVRRGGEAERVKDVLLDKVGKGEPGYDLDDFRGHGKHLCYRR